MERRMRSVFGPREITRIVAAAQSMYFFNLLGNTFESWFRGLVHLPERRPESSCSLDLLD